MTNSEKIIKIIEAEDDILVSYYGEEVVEIDLEDNQFFLLDGDTVSFEEINNSEDGFLVYEFDELEFPEDIFDLATLLKKIKREIETSKEKIVLFVDEREVCTEDQLNEYLEISGFMDYIGVMNFFSKNVKKNYFQKMK